MQEIISAVRTAVKLCRDVQHHYLVANTKTSGDSKEPVTIADFGAQAIICRAIQNYFPDDAVIAEESGKQFMELTSIEQKATIIELISGVLETPVTLEEITAWLDHGKSKTASRTWVIDPVDGTKGFVAMRHYAIAVGLLVDGYPTEGIVACPGYGDDGALFYTDNGETFQAPLLSGKGDLVLASKRTAPSEFVTVQSFEKKHASKSRMESARELLGLEESPVFELDSMEKYALVACGDADLYLRLPVEGGEYGHRAWDHAAGTALVIHAGGKVTDIDGSPLDFSQGAILPNQGMIVSNGEMHDKIVEAVMQVMSAS